MRAVSRAEKAEGALAESKAGGAGKYHVYLHDTQERLSLLASGPRDWAIEHAHKYLQVLEPDSEARIVISRVEDELDAGDFLIRELNRTPAMCAAEQLEARP